MCMPTGDDDPRYCRCIPSEKDESLLTNGVDFFRQPLIFLYTKLFVLFALLQRFECVYPSVVSFLFLRLNIWYLYAFWG